MVLYSKKHCQFPILFHISHNYPFIKRHLLPKGPWTSCHDKTHINQQHKQEVIYQTANLLHYLRKKKTNFSTGRLRRGSCGPRTHMGGVGGAAARWCRRGGERSGLGRGPMGLGRFLLQMFSQHCCFVYFTT